MGTVVSTTKTFCSVLAVLPDTSVAVQVTIVSPSGKNSGASFVNEISCTSKTDGLSRLTVFSAIEVASIVTSPTGKISGVVVSTIETVWVAVAEFPDESVAVHVTTVSPSGKVSGASLVTEAMSILSVAVASPKLI